jgi:predicted AlkP superfamily pyrophosphatase or phosphodiesterase
MILHYLGLDHVGHIEGPFAPYNIHRKLHEMDEIIRKLYSSLSKNDILLVLSDHGMANEGGHGGSSNMELKTPALFVSKSFSDHPNCLLSDSDLFDLADNMRSREQVDLVSTLSCLFDLEVPANNKGLNFLSDLKAMNCSNQFSLADKINLELNVLKCMKRNFEQLNRQFNMIKNEYDKVQIREINNKLQKVLSEHFSETKLALVVELRERLEMLIRRNLRDLDEDKSKNHVQNYYLVLAILLILNVTFPIFDIQTFNQIKLFL